MCSHFAQTIPYMINWVNGKKFLCEGNIGDPEALRVGAIGVLTQGRTSTDVAFSFAVPGYFLQSKDAAKIHKYICSSRSPTAAIFKTEELEDTLAPMVASFEPDLIAPGVDIIAIWSSISSVSKVDGDNRKLEFNIMSVTSMACPHVSGAAGYIKSYHPTWSPAAIRSALMTTAKQMSPVNNLDAEFAYGVGQIDPIKAVNPGLIYDVSEIDYIRYLCGQSFNATILKLITRNENNCSESTTSRDLNYPSFAFKAPRPKHHLSRSFFRTVTNVGLPISTYKAIVTGPKGVNISVKPDILSFTSLGEK